MDIDNLIDRKHNLIHLEFLGENAAFNFIDQIAVSAPDSVLIGGDTGTAKNKVNPQTLPYLWRWS